MQPRLQTDIERKRQQARQAGYSDAEINQYLAQSGIAARPQQQVQPTAQRKGGFQPSALISETGGFGGALAGGAAGAALGSVVPVIGTAIGGVVGAGLGGFLGGTGGSAVEQQVRDKKVNTGKALREGAIEGLFAAGPLKLLRGGKALAKGAKAGSKGLNLADDLSQALVGTTTRAGQATTGAARGIRTGSKVGGDRLLPKQAKEINDFLTKTVKTRAASPGTQLEDLAKYQDTMVSKLDRVVNKFNKTLGKKDKIFLANKLGKSFSESIAGATNSQRELAAQLAKEISEKGSLKDLNDYVKLLDKQINFDRPLDAVSAQREQVFRLFRKELRDSITDPDVIPGLKNIKSNLAKSYQAQELLLESSGRLSSAFNPVGVRVPNTLIQGAQARVGRGLERTGRVLDSTSPLATALRVGAGSQVASALGGQDTGAQLDATQFTQAGQFGGEQDVFSQLTGALGGQEMGGQDIGQTQQQTSRLTQEDINQAILLDLQETGGANVEQIQMIAQMYGPQAQTQGQQFEDLTADQQKRIQNLNTVASALDNLEREASESGIFREESQLASTIRGPIERAVGGATDPAKRQYISSLRSRGIQIIRALGEVGNLSQSEQDAAAANLPRPGDNAETAFRKIQSLRNLFGEIQQNVSNPQLTGGFEQ